MVEPTDTVSKYTRAPWKEPEVVLSMTAPLTSSLCAPIIAKPFKCWSIGRTPKLQPPGRATFALWKRPSNAPKR